MRRLFFTEVLDALEERVVAALTAAGLDSVSVDVTPRPDVLEQVVLWSPGGATFIIEDWGHGDSFTPGPCTITHDWTIRAQIIAVRRGDQYTESRDVRRLAMAKAQQIMEVVLDASIGVPFVDAPEIICEPAGGEPPIPYPLSDGDGWFAEAFLDVVCHGALQS